MSRIRIGFVGAKHPHIFPRLDLAAVYADRCEVVGVYDTEQKTLDYIQEKYGVKTYTDVNTLLSSGLDVAIIEGHDYEKLDFVTESLPHVKAILLEKPGAPTIEEMRQIVEQCAKYPVHVSVGYMLQWSPIIRKLEHIVQSGVLGPITLARFHAATPVGGAAEIWQSLPEDEGGLVWTDGCHMVRVIMSLLGMPQGVLGLVKKLPPGEKVKADIFKPDILSGLGKQHPVQIGTLVHEDVAGAVLDYQDKMACFDITGWEAHGWVEQWRIELWGANATLEAGLMPPWYRLHVRTPHEEYGVGTHEFHMAGPGSAETSLVADDAYTQEFLNLLDVVERGDVSQDDLRQGLATLEVLHGIYESSKRNQRVSFTEDLGG